MYILYICVYVCVCRCSSSLRLRVRKRRLHWKLSRAAFQGVTQFRKGSGQHCPGLECPTTLLIPFNKVKLTLFHTHTHTYVCMHACIDKHFAPFCVFVVVNINTAKYKEKTCLCLWKMKEFSRQEQQKKEHENVIMIMNHIIVIISSSWGESTVWLAPKLTTLTPLQRRIWYFCWAQNKENFEQGLLLFFTFFLCISF